MNKPGPIIVIEDDFEDQELLEETFKVLNYPNKVIFFSNGFSALNFLISSGTNPFLILSDINVLLMLAAVWIGFASLPAGDRT